MAVEETPREDAFVENPHAEIDARMIELRRELAELYALRAQQLVPSPRMTTPCEETPHFPKAGDPQAFSPRPSFAKRLLRTGGAAVRYIWRSPTAVFTDLERYLARSRHQPHQWDSAEGNRIAVENRLQDVWPLNVDVLPHQTPTLNLLLPSLRKRDLTGGPNTALNLFVRLAARGIPVRFVATDCELDADEAFLRQHLQSVSGIGRKLDNVQFLSARDRSRAVVLGADDVLCGTAWWTAQMIQEIQPRLRSRRFWYLIQDYEPGMYAWSTKQALARETYGMDFQGIICGSFLADYLSAERIGRFAEPGFLDSCVVFEPAVDSQRFFPDFDSIAQRKKRLLFYARPQTPRNLFELGLVALKLATERGAFPAADWELGFLGGNLPAADLRRGVTIRPYPWRNYHAYAKLLQSTDVGLSLMLSPHTSYPPLEMAACGATVVTNTFAVKTSQRLQRISENLLPVEPRLENIVEGLLAAANRADHLPQRFAGSVLNVPPDWDAALDPLVPRLLALWESCRGN